MHGTPPALFEALEALRQNLGLQLEDARVRAAGLLDAGRFSERSSPVADRNRRHRVIELATTASVLRMVCEELEELLGEFEEREEADNQLDPRGLSTARVAADVQAPDTF